MAVLADRTVLPPDAGADTRLPQIAAIVANCTALSVSDEQGRTSTLPSELRDILAYAVQALSEGQAVSLEPRHTILSTQEAADLLGISRPTLVKLLESGAVPFTKPGRHRRVRLQDILEYQLRLRQERHRHLDAMTSEAADDDAYHQVNGLTGTR